jgi:hypothetical protein
MYNNYQYQRSKMKQETPPPKKKSVSFVLILLIVIGILILGYGIITKYELADLQLITPSWNNHASSTATSTATSTTDTSEIIATSETTILATPVPKAAPLNTTTPTPSATPQIHTQTAYITKISSSIIGLDYVNIYRDEAALRQMVADGKCALADPNICDLDDNTYYQNTDPTTHYFTLMPDVEIQKWTGTKDYISNLKRNTPSDTIYTVTFNEYNQVTRIKEVYRR